MIRFILADLRRLWIGALIMVLLVTFAVALGAAVTLQERALRLGSARAADKFDVIIGAAGSETQLVLSTVFLQPAPLPLMRGDVLTRLQHDPRVTWAAPVGFGDSYLDYPIVGTTHALMRGTTAGLLKGRPFGKTDEAVIGAAVDLPLQTEITPLHGIGTHTGHAHEEIRYRVVGQLQPTGTSWDRAILVPIQSVWQIHGMTGSHRHASAQPHPFNAMAAGQAPDTGLHEHFDEKTPGLPAILVKPASIADAYKLRQEYRSGDTLAVFPAEVLTRLYGTLGDIRQILAAIASATQVLVAAALGMMAIMHISQRRRQIAALRALGAPRSIVSGMVWLELFALMGVGILFGLALGLAASTLLAQTLTARSGIVMPVEFLQEDWLPVLCLFGGAALLATLPAWLAYRQSPAQSLTA